MVLEADELTVTEEDGELVGFEAIGNPAKLNLQSDESEDVPNIVAQAKKITFDEAQNDIKFLEEAKIQKDDTVLRSDNITYNITTREIVAEHGEIEVSLSNQEQ